MKSPRVAYGIFRSVNIFQFSLAEMSTGFKEVKQKTLNEIHSFDACIVQLNVYGRLTACSHEPGTVDYLRVMIALGQALPRVHMIVCCPRQVHRHLISKKLFEFLYFLHKLLQRMNLNTFIYFWCFLEPFIGKFIPKIKGHVHDYSYPEATFVFCSHGEK